MSLSQFTQSSEFKRVTSTATESALKVLFKGIGIAVVGLANFAKQVVMSIFGK